jgi:hypothetical protein
MPQELVQKVEALTGCISGAASKETLEQLLRDAGFESVSVEVNLESRSFIRDWMPGSGAEKYVASATVQGVKPGGAKACCGPACCTPGASA